MKTNIKFLLVALVAFSAFSITSCSEDDPAPTPTPAPQTIAQIAQGNSELETLVVALNRTGLTSVLNGSGQYTVFAPTDEAFDTFFSSLPTPGVNVNNVDVDVLENILLNHVILTKFTAAQLTTSYKKTLATSAAVPATATDDQKKMNIYINNSASGVFLNGGAKVTAADINASNGVVHVVNKVIGLPTIVTFVGADPNFSSLLAALTRPDQLDESFTTTLSGTAGSPFTVFAPTTAAFDSLLAELGPGITLANIPEQTLTKALKYHVVAGSNVLSTSLTNNMPVSTILGQDFTIEILLTTGAQIKDANNRISKIVAVDVQADNGVVHVIDKVLLPL
jgi:uncharacterized surface protein with fasciclin (FAS1) repeats